LTDGVEKRALESFFHPAGLFTIVPDAEPRGFLPSVAGFSLTRGKVPFCAEDRFSVVSPDDRNACDIACRPCGVVAGNLRIFDDVV
jgi:hypothetical protein